MSASQNLSFVDVMLQHLFPHEQRWKGLHTRQEPVMAQKKDDSIGMKMLLAPFIILILITFKEDIRRIVCRARAHLGLINDSGAIAREKKASTHGRLFSPRDGAHTKRRNQTITRETQVSGRDAHPSMRDSTPLMRKGLRAVHQVLSSTMDIITFVLRGVSSISQGLVAALHDRLFAGRQTRAMGPNLENAATLAINPDPTRDIVDQYGRQMLHMLTEIRDILRRPEANTNNIDRHRTELPHIPASDQHYVHFAGSASPACLNEELRRLKTAFNARGERLQRLKNSADAQYDENQHLNNVLDGHTQSRWLSRPGSATSHGGPSTNSHHAHGATTEVSNRGMSSNSVANKKGGPSINYYHDHGAIIKDFNKGMSANPVTSKKGGPSTNSHHAHGATTEVSNEGMSASPVSNKKNGPNTISPDRCGAIAGPLNKEITANPLSNKQANRNSHTDHASASMHKLLDQFKNANWAKTAANAEDESWEKYDNST